MHHQTIFIRDNKDIVILSEDEDSSIVIMNEKDYNRKIENMINKGKPQEKHKENDNNILNELESFHPFPYWHFKNSP